MDFYPDANEQTMTNSWGRTTGGAGRSWLKKGETLRTAGQKTIITQILTATTSVKSSFLLFSGSI